MTLCDVYIALGEEKFRELLKCVSMSRLRTYQIFDHIKTRTRLVKLNSENLRKAAPRLWERLAAQDDALAGDLAQAILVSQLDLIVAALDFLGVPHQDGFFSKETKISGYLTGDWAERCTAHLSGKFAPAAVQFYLNHLALEAGVLEELIPSASPE
jgi:hypothetical protein